MDEEGRVLERIDLEALATALEEVVARGEEVPAVAVCFLFSYLNPEHELAARELLAQRFPELAVSLSHEVAPIWREYERGTTVTVDAYLKPLFERYVDGVSTALEGKGTGGTWALLKSNGGHALAGEARARPAHLLLSGIAGGAIGGAYAARAAGAPEAIALDMGGTSCDVCLIVGGEPLYSSDFEIEFGLPVSVPSVSTRTIGAGGGSIGWVDPGGFLQVGPQSAGAVPGPACYGQGGESATITDADVVLGRLDPAFFLGGKLPLDAGARTRRARRAGRPARARPRRDGLGDGAHLQREHGQRDPHRDGRAGDRPARVRARRLRRRGRDPRLRDRRRDRHAPRRRAAAPGALLRLRSARRDRARGRGAQRLPHRSHDLGGRARRAVRRARGAGARRRGRPGARAAADRAPLDRDALPGPELRAGGRGARTATVDDAALAEVYAEYGRLYEGFYGYRLDGIPIELVRLSVVAMGEPPVFAGLPSEDAEGEGAARRDVFFPGSGFVPTDIVRRERLAAGETRAGPLIVESMDSTVVVPPGWTLSAEATGILDLTRA